MSTLTEREAPALTPDRRVSRVREAFVGIMTIAVFALDMMTPLGFMAPILYVLLVYISLQPSVAQPQFVATVCTLLTFVGGVLAPMPDIPEWIGIVNRVMAVVLMWALLAFNFPRHRANTAPRQQELDGVDHEQVNRALRELAQSLLQAQHVANLGSWELDLTVLDDVDGNPLLRWSDEVFCIFGYEPGSIEASHENFFRAVHPDDRDAIRKAIAHTLAAGEPYSIDHRIVLPDGSERMVHEYGEIIRDPATGAPVKMLGTVQDITERKRAEEELRRSEERFRLAEEELRKSAQQLRALSRRLLNAEENERRGLTRELHDRVGQSLTALNLILSRLARELPENAPHSTRQGLRESLQLVEATAESIENVMVDLRPPMLDDYGLLPALRWYADLFSKRTNIAATVSGQEPAPRLPQEIELTLFRIFQEALTNVAKHARSINARIVLRQENGTVTLTVADDGAGFATAVTAPDRDQPRWGLMSMRERIQAVGGTLRIDSVPGAGTTVMAEVEHRI